MTKKTRNKKLTKKKESTRAPDDVPKETLDLEQSFATLRDKEIDNKHFWKNFIKALDAEPREEALIRGRSGVDHKLLGIGVNDKDNRLVLVSDTPSAEHAAMMQVDVAAGTDLNVVVARPAAFDLVKPIRTLISAVGSPIITSDHISNFGSLNQSTDETRMQAAMRIFFVNVFGGFGHAALQAFKFTPLSAFSQTQQFLNQLSFIDFSSARKDDGGFALDLEPFSNLDVTSRDRELGNCPVPLFEFNEQQMETVLSGTSQDAVAEVLHDLDIHQYFFPNPDEVGLGLVDGGVVTPESVRNALVIAPEIGHPYSGERRTFSPDDAMEMIQALIADDKLDEAEVLTITPQGEEQRFKLRTRPAEGLIVKILKAVFGKDFHLHLPPS